MKHMLAWMDRKWYPNHDKNWDDQLFRECILANITARSVVLDLGAGAGIVTQMNVKDHAARVCGVDLDSRVIRNPFLDEGKVSDAGEIPYADGQFDIVFSDNVLEHLEEPLSVFKEVSRVLKPGGLFLFKTPNKWHYMPIIARLTSHKFHQFINRIRGRFEVDTFPTRYKANTRADIQRLAKAADFAVESIQHIEGRPEYLRMTVPTYAAGAVYERIVNSTTLLEAMRVLLIGVLKKRN